MFNLIFKSLFKIFSIFTGIILISACNGDSDNKSKDPLEVTNPNKITWTEGESFNYQIKTNQGPELTFSLENSEDSNLFSIDPVSGVITAEDVFDYETFNDADLDGVYELRIKIDSTESEIRFHDLSISLENKDEFEITTDFPINNGNLGGFEDSVTVRGKLEDISENKSSSIEGLYLFVNEVQTDINSDLTWNSTVPITYGDNSINISLKGNSNIEAEKQLFLNNNFIANKRKIVVVKEDEFIYIDQSGKKLLLENTMDGTLSSFAGIESFQAIGDCKSFSNIKLLNDSKLLLVECSLVSEEKFNSFLYDLEYFSINQVSTAKIDGRSKLHLYKDSFLFNQEDSESFRAVDIKSGEQIRFYKNSAFWSRDPYTVGSNSFFEIANSNLDGPMYLIRYKFESLADLESGEYDLDPEYYLDLSILDEIWGEGYFNINDALLHYFEEKIYVISLPNITIFDLDGNYIDSAITQGISETTSLYNLRILTSNSSKLILGRINTNERIQLDLMNFVAKTVTSNSQGLSFSGGEYNQQENSIKGTSFFERQLNTLSLDNYTATQDVELSDLDTKKAFSQYDTETNSILLSYFWSHQEPANSDKTALSIFEPESGIITPYFSMIDFHNFLSVGDDSNHYEFGNFVYGKDKNIVIFSVSVLQSDETTSNGLFSYNLENNSFSKLIFDESFNDESSIFSNLNPYLISRYYEGIDGHILTNWGNGQVLLFVEGELITLFSENQIYPITFTGRYNHITNEIYFSAYGKDANSDYFNDDKRYIISINLNTLESKIIASSVEPQTLKVTGIDIYLDEKKQLIYQIGNENLLVIDIVNDDRILVPFTTNMD